MTDFDEWLFPHEQVRDNQKQMIESVISCLEKKEHAVIHAPTGLGKTASTLAPALAYAIKNKKVVFFLTSRHTQHHIVIDTLKMIKEKHKVDFCVTDIIGKKWMCLQSGANILSSSDFSEYCNVLKEDGSCKFYEMAREKSKVTPKAAALIEKLSRAPIHIDEFIAECRAEDVCPYELALAHGVKSKVIVADYNYIFNSHIRNAFLKKINKEMSDCIIIVDEGHNLPERMRELQSTKLSTISIHKAMKEAKRHNCKDAFPILERLYQILVKYAEKGNEVLVDKKTFHSDLNEFKDYDEIIELFETYAEMIRAEQKSSYLGSIANFLESWTNGEKGFVRYISKIFSRGADPIYVLTKRCLDPSLVTFEPITQSCCTIIMSGTLTPTSMYKELLGFPKNTQELVFKSPFPVKNKMVLVVPETSTKFTTRSTMMYERMAAICASITNQVPGNTAIFFPSYAIRDEVAKLFTKLSKKTLFSEMSIMKKEEKKELLEKFTSYKDIGAVLLGVASGNFSEGIDLPGVLKCVVIVGLPLQRPNLEMKELIAYYDGLFNKGWDYGYIFPAFSKCVQSAGRAIRTENDRGVLIFLDERFSWPMYQRYFPKDWEIITTRNYSANIQYFFSEKQ